jgi:hypothetical protein
MPYVRWLVSYLFREKRKTLGAQIIQYFMGVVAHNKSLQTDNLRAVRIVVSLSLNFTTRRTAHKLRLTAALCEKIRQQK